MIDVTTTHVINSAKDALSGKDKVVANSANTELNIKRVGKFAKADCVVFKNAPVTTTFTSAEFKTLSSITSGALCRLAVYIRLTEGNMYSLYANDFVFRGKPLYIEFKAGANAGATADNLIAAAKAVFGSLYDIEYFKIAKDSSNNVTITGVDEFQLFTKASIQVWTESASSPALTSQIGSFVDTIAGTIVKNITAKGSYDQILRDLRLPTIENLRWKSPNEPEMPIPGATYVQYIIHMTKNAGIVNGNAVGLVGKSKTTHVIYVKSDLANVITEIEKVFTTSDLHTVATGTDTDDVFVDETEVAAKAAADLTAHSAKTKDVHGLTAGA